MCPGAGIECGGGLCIRCAGWATRQRGAASQKWSIEADRSSPQTRLIEIVRLGTSCKRKLSSPGIAHSSPHAPLPLLRPRLRSRLSQRAKATWRLVALAKGSSGLLTSMMVSFGFSVLAPSYSLCSNRCLVWGRRRHIFVHRRCMDVGV